MDTEEAWQQFQKSSAIQKSVDNNSQNLMGKLDTLLAQQQEILTNTQRTADIVPKILGDESAIDAANDEAAMQQQMMAQMGGMPPGGAPMGAPMEEGAPEGAPPEEGQGGGNVTDEQIDQLLGGGVAPPTEEGTPDEGAPVPEGALPEGAEGEIANEGVPSETGETPGVPPVLEGAGGASGGALDNILSIFDEEATKAIANGDTAGAIEILEAKMKVQKSALDGVPLSDESIAKSDGTESIETSESDEDASEDDLTGGKSVNKGPKMDEANKLHEEAMYEKDRDKSQEMMRKVNNLRAEARESGDRDPQFDPRKWKREQTGKDEIPPVKEKTGHKAASAAQVMPSFRDMVAYHEANPLAGVYDRGVSIRKSMCGEIPAISNETEAIAKADVESEPMPMDEEIADEGVEEPIDDIADDEVAIDEEGEIEAILEPIIEYCVENGITAEGLEQMSDEELADLIATALGGGEEDVPEDDINIEDVEIEEPIPEDVPEAEPVAEDTAEIGKSATEQIEKSDDEIQEAGCPCDGLTGPDRIEKDSVASASEVHPHTSVNDTGTSHSVEGVMPSSGTHDPDAIASAKPTTGPLKTGLNVMKSEGKHIVSMRELMERNVKKSQSARPDSVCSTNGDLSRPEVSTVAKSAGPTAAGTQSKDLNGFIESARNGMQRYREATAKRENII